MKKTGGGRKCPPEKESPNSFRSFYLRIFKRSSSKGWLKVYDDVRSGCPPGSDRGATGWCRKSCLCVACPSTEPRGGSDPGRSSQTHPSAPPGLLVLLPCSLGRKGTFRNWPLSACLISGSTPDVWSIEVKPVCLPFSCASSGLTSDHVALVIPPQNRIWPGTVAPTGWFIKEHPFCFCSCRFDSSFYY